MTEGSMDALVRGWGREREWWMDMVLLHPGTARDLEAAIADDIKPVFGKPERDEP